MSSLVIVRLLTTLRASAASLVAAVLSLGMAAYASAATTSASRAFSFVHTGSVSTGLLSVGGTFTNTTNTVAPTITVPQFNPALGRLTGVNVSVTTSTATFNVAPVGLLSLVATATATRRLTYAVTAGTVGGGDYNEVVTTGSSLLTLLSIGGGDIGGAPLAKSTAYAASADLAMFTGTGSFSVNLTATNTFSVFALVSALDGAGLAGNGTYAGTVNVTYQYTPWSIAGSVYRDANHDGFKGAGETGTGLTLYAKLLSGTAGPALQATAVDPSTGFYAFAAAKGSYRIVIDDNANLADVTPLQPPTGWNATQAASLYRDVVAAGDLAGQDFGLVRAATIAGRVFIDDGSGGGIANDGIANGGEKPAYGRSVELVDAGGAVLDVAGTASDGSYRLFIPSTVIGGASLRVRQGTDPTTLTTGVGIGNTAGVFDRATRSIAFVYAADTNYANVNFGSVPVPTLSADMRRAGRPSASVFFTHRYTATSAGQLTFSTSHVATAGDLPWSEAVYLDANANGILDAGELPLTAPLSVTAGQTVAVVMRVSVPANSPRNVVLRTVVQAAMAFANAAPPYTYAVSASDDTLTTAADEGSVALVKSVDKSSGTPGASLTYTLTFTNMGTEPVANFTVSDATPAYTTLQSLGAVVRPPGLQMPVTVAPAVGSAGALQWTFGGELAPNASGSVQFTVVLDP